MAGINRMSCEEAMNAAGTLIVTTASDGAFGQDDTLRIVSDEYFDFDCRGTRLADYLPDPLIASVQSTNVTLPASAGNVRRAAYCVWGATNGRLVNRYSALTGYEQKLVLCDGLMHIYSVLARDLLDSGYPREQMYERLDRAVTMLQ